MIPAMRRLALPFAALALSCLALPAQVPLHRELAREDQVAQAMDRDLSFTVGTQKNGTNRLIHPETGREAWVPIDRNTTNEERKRYGEPPLAELLKQFPEGR